MTASAAELLAQHASMAELKTAWEAFVRRGEVLDGVRPVVCDAWKRCRAYGVNPDKLKAQHPDPERLRNALARSQALVGAAEPHLEAVREALADRPFLIALLDAEGIVLSVRGDSATLAQQTEVVPGVSWSERDVGSTAGGSALATGKPMVLLGPEHYNAEHHDWT